MGYSSSFNCYKKVISFYIPCQFEALSIIIKPGNLTRSVDVNDITKAVKKKEVRQQEKLKCQLQF
eukprot:12576173-Ditylum_brightwellii.AAC.1